MKSFDVRRLLLALILSGLVAFVSVVWFPNWLSVGFLGLLVLFAGAFYAVTGFVANFNKAYSKEHVGKVSHEPVVEQTHAPIVEKLREETVEPAKLSTPTPNLYREGPTPKQIREALRIDHKDLALLQRESLQESITQSYKGIKVCWQLTLNSLTAKGSKVEAVLTADRTDNFSDFTVVKLAVDLAKYPELRIVKSGCQVLVRGTIERVDRLTIVHFVELKDAEIELGETA